MNPFDAVLVVAFGGPGGPADVRPFLANVLRGRRVTPERIEEVVGHYDLFGGISPLAETTMKQARGLEQRLVLEGLNLPVYVGMRNWHPLLPDTLRAMSLDGVRRAVGLTLAPHRSYSSCTQYRQNVLDARAELAGKGMPDVAVTYVGDWHRHPKFIKANQLHVRAALERLPGELRPSAQLVFTAHSVPAAMTGAERYQQQVNESAELVACAVGSNDWTVVFQSRSGRPEDPWLGPDVCEYLRSAAGSVAGVVLVPIGFVCDHIEVLYDLDHEAADVVLDVLNIYRSGQPLAIVSASVSP